MKNLVYCRVSSSRDDSYGFSIQEENCLEYCKQNKMRVREIHKEYNSGNGKQKILIDLISKYKCINLIVYDVTRFSRNVTIGSQLLDKCIKNKITVHFVKENIVYNNLNHNTVMTGLQNSENEWNQIRKRIIDSIAYRRQNGLCLGNAPFGFTTINKKLVKNDDFNAIRLIVALKNGVKSCTDIQQILKTLSSEYETLKFYDENDNEIEFFTANEPLTYQEIAQILNDYSVCNIHWIRSRVKELYNKYSSDLEFIIPNNIIQNMELVVI